MLEFCHHQELLSLYHEIYINVNERIFHLTNFSILEKTCEIILIFKMFLNYYGLHHERLLGVQVVRFVQ